MGPWLEQVDLTWRPELAFFEMRSEILRELEGAGLLQQFKWTVDDVTVLIDQHEAIRIGANGATLLLGSPRVDGRRVTEALRLVLDRMGPEQIVFRSISSSVLHPIDRPSEDIEAITAETGAKINPFMPSADSTDWALLVDGTCRLAPGTFKVEYGVLAAEEARIRLTQAISRVGTVQLPFPPDLSDLPSCAYFFVWEWRVMAIMGDDPSGETQLIWDAVSSAREKLSIEAIDRLSGGGVVGEMKA